MEEMAKQMTLTRTSLAASIMSLALLGGCSSGKGDGSAKQASSGSGEPSRSAPQPTEKSTADLIRDQLLGSNNGLEIRRWTVLDTVDRAAAVVAEHADGGAAGETACARLRQNGFRFARVPADQLDTIVAALGGATVDRNEWHGQVYDWRSLREQTIDSRGTAVAIDGRVRRFDRGEFRLLIRGWTIMMEDGPRLHMEILPQHRLPAANNLRRLLNENPEDAGEAFASMALDLDMQAGFAYVLIGESPTIDWPQLDKPAPAVVTVPASAMQSSPPPAPAAASAQAAAPPPAVAPPRPRVGPDDSIGPEAGTPRTLGEVLLPNMPSPPTRDIIVFVPKIPDEMFPPVYASDLAAPSNESSAGQSGQGHPNRKRVDR